MVKFLSNLEAFKRRIDARSRQYLIVLSVLIVSLLLYNSIPSTKSFPHIRVTYETWADCMKKAIEDYEDNQVYLRIGQVIQKCNSLINFESDRLIKLEDTEAGQRYHILPINSMVSSLVLSLGLDRSIIGESHLKPLLSKNSLIIGVDPDTANHDNFRSIGMFLPMSIGNKVGNRTIESGKDYSSFQITLQTLLEEYIPKYTKVVDNIWMDIDYSKFNILDYFTSTKDIFKSGYSICQLNLDIHTPKTEKQKIFFSKFIQQILDDERYFFTRVGGTSGRLFFIDFSDNNCIEKYILGW